MNLPNPAAITVGDICTAALQESGWLGVGQTPLAEDLNGAQFRLQSLLQQWYRKRWMVYCLVTYNVTSTGAQSYSVGPGGAINTGAGTVRPEQIESGFIRQLTQSQPNQIDYPMEIIRAKEDYNRLALKSLTSFPGLMFLDPQWPLGQLYPWPVPQANIYGIFITVKANLPQAFANQAATFSMPYEYYAAMHYSLAERIRAWKAIPSWPGDGLAGLAKDARNVLRTGNATIAQLIVPSNLIRGKIYNIFADRSY